MWELCLMMALIADFERPVLPEHLLNKIPTELLAQVLEYHGATDEQLAHLVPVSREISESVNRYLWGENPTDQQLQAVTNYVEAKTLQLAEEMRQAFDHQTDMSVMITLAAGSVRAEAELRIQYPEHMRLRLRVLKSRAKARAEQIIQDELGTDPEHSGS